ncbi:MAG: SCO family protein [Caldilineaceae bacterium]
MLQEPPLALEDFSLSGDDGTQFHLADLRGKYILLTFGYTSCPDVCPTTLAMLRLTREKLEIGKGQMAVVFISVDPERDTSEKVRNYATLFADDFIGVTGHSDEIDQAVKQFGATYRIDKGQVTLNTGYEVSHSAYVYVVDPEFRLRMAIPFGAQINEIVGDLQAILDPE